MNLICSPYRFGGMVRGFLHPPAKFNLGYLLRTSQRSFDLQIKGLYEKKLKECKEDNVCEK